MSVSNSKNDSFNQNLSTCDKALNLTKCIMDKNIESFILSSTNSKKILSQELIQDLWSGYGQITRVTTDSKSVILKKIIPISINPYYFIRSKA